MLRVALHGGDVQLMPTKAHESDAGYDLFARGFQQLRYSVEKSEDVLNPEVFEECDLQCGRRILALTGVFLGLKPGYEAQIRPRSGLALKHGLTVVNSPGTIDEGYRGEIGVILCNTGNHPVRLFKYNRIAQMVIAPVLDTKLDLCDRFEDPDVTERGAGGFGHTGV